MAGKSSLFKMWVALSIGLVFFLASCGGSEFDSSADTSSEETESDRGFDGADAGEPASMDMDTSAEEPEDASFASEGDVDDDGGDVSASVGQGAAVPVAVVPADLGRKIIFTADVELDVDDVAAAGAEAVRAIESIGGFVFGQESTGGLSPVSTFTFKVRPENFDRAVEALGGIGDLRSQRIGADDVTERVVDLASRIEVAELGVARLRGALESAPSLEDYAEIERLLLSRESDLEVMKGQLRTIQDRVDLATITLTLRQEGIENSIGLSVTSYEAHDRGISCPGEADLIAVPEDADLTICYEIINTGDQTLTDISISDSGLGIGVDNRPIEVFGSLDEDLPPGQSLILAVEIKPERNLRMRTTAGARPVAGESGEAGPPVSGKYNTTIQVYEVPKRVGVSDGFRGSVDLLLDIGYWIVVAVAALAPFGLVLLPIVLVVWYVRGLLPEKPRKVPMSTTPVPPTVTPPPPPAPPAPQDEGSGQ